MEGLVDLYSRPATRLHPIDFTRENPTIDFTSISQQSRNARTEVVHRQIRAREVLAESIDRSARGPGPHTCIVRVELITTDNPFRLNIRKSNWRYVLDLFGLSDWVDFAQTATMTFDVVPRYERGSYCGFFASIFIEHFIGLYYIYDQNKDQSLGVFWANDLTVMSRFLESLSSLRALAVQPGFLLLAGAATINAYHNQNFADRDQRISQIEKRTGYQGWDLAAHKEARGTFSKLSEEMSGIATSLAADKRLSAMNAEVLSAIGGQATVAEGGVPHNSNHLVEPFDSCVALLRRRTVIGDMHLELLLARVRNQLTALFNLINRKETELSIEVAKDSRLIAVSSKRDSTSMKTLAAVTVVFLPGTFVASLFSMSVFDFQPAPGKIVTYWFGIYWAITVPLTIITVLIWKMWINKRKAHIDTEDHEAEKYITKMKF